MVNLMKIFKNQNSFMYICSILPYLTTAAVHEIRSVPENLGYKFKEFDGRDDEILQPMELDKG